MALGNLRVELLRPVTICGATYAVGTQLDVNEQAEVCFGHGPYYPLVIGEDARWLPSCLSTHGLAGPPGLAKVLEDGRVVCICGEPFLGKYAHLSAKKD